MPFPTTRVIPAGWSEHHRPVTEGAMTAECTVTTPDPNAPGGWDPDTGPTPAGALTLYTGACRVQALRDQRRSGTESADQPITDRTYLVVLTHTSVDIPAGQHGATVLITQVDPNGDPELVGRRLRVVNAAYGSLHWERDLTCTDDQTNQP